MPEIRTDDAPRRLRQVWLGPRGFRLWFEWTYPRLFAFVLAWSITGPAAWFVLSQTGSRVHVAFVLGVFGYGAGLAYVISRLVMVGVTADEPLLYRLFLFAAALRPRKTVKAEPAIIHLAVPPIAEMSPGLRRAITGRNTTAPVPKETATYDHAPARPLEAVPFEAVEVTGPREDQPRPRRAADTAAITREARPRRAAS